MPDRREPDQTAEATATATAAEVLRVAAATAADVLATAARTSSTQGEGMRVDLGHIKADLAEIKVRLDHKYVTLEAFDPIRNVVYGLVALMLIGVVGGLLALVLRTN